jgi:hypothetical protein
MAAIPAGAQITSGTVTGTIINAQGTPVPGATAVLVSESRGTRSVPAVTNESGDYVFANVTPDVYTMEVTMRGFKRLRRPGIAVSGGDRLPLGPIGLQAGEATDTVDVTAEAPRLQSESGERSFAISASQIESLPLSGDRNFMQLTQLAPGVNAGGSSGGGTRIGGAGYNNITMDGVSTVDTSNNGQMLNMSIESIAEVKVLTQSYQAEYGRFSGLQVNAVTKSGTNRFHGSFYDIEDNSDWNTQSWAGQKNRDPKEEDKSRAWGYSIGGPVGRSGGNNKLFFFYTHEYRPRTTQGAVTRFRVPTTLERSGDFSQSLDNNGQPIPQLLNPITREPYPNNVIPEADLYAAGLAILSQYPVPNVPQQPGSAHNLELLRPEDKNLTQQPAIRVDYQFSPGLRVTGKYSAEWQRERVRQGTMPGFNDVLLTNPDISSYGVTVTYAMGRRTFLEATYGRSRNALAGGIPFNAAANLENTLGALPLLYPLAGASGPESYQTEVLARTNPPFFDGSFVNLPPTFVWGTRVGATPLPSHQYPDRLSTNRTWDAAATVTTIAARHTLKFGLTTLHSYRAQNTGASGNLSFQGHMDFGNDTNNPFDTGFGFANAATGVVGQYLQQSTLIEGSMLYRTLEAYLQDTWKVTNRLTLDLGVRATHQQPEHDEFERMLNFFPELWNRNAAPLLYVPTCVNGAPTCASHLRTAKHPITGQVLESPGLPTTAAAIGTIIPDSGDVYAGLRLGGDGIVDEAYGWPTFIFAPRFGMAYDLTGRQRVVLRGGAGLFYDRPEGDTVLPIPGNAPFAESTEIRYGRLQTIDTALAMRGASDLVIFQYNAKVPSSVHWNAGVQMSLPWSSSLDVSYVGSYGFNRLGGQRAANTVNLNAIDFGTAYRAEFQDPTRTPNPAVPGSTALEPSLLRPFRGYGVIAQHTTEFHETFHSVQTSFTRRFGRGLSFGANYTLTLQLEGNTGLTQRLEHAPDGTIAIRADQDRYEDLNKTLDLQRHVMRGHFVWDLPDLSADGGARRVLAAIVNDWQVSGIASLESGHRYDITFGYDSNGTALNLTGSPDYENNGTGARVVYLRDPGSGCSDNQYAQFDVTAVTGPDYNSVGLESGRNRMAGCPTRLVDLSFARNIRLGGNRSLQLRLDAFNVFNIVNYTNRQSHVVFNNPTEKLVVNSQLRPDGSVDPNRLTPANAGFGAATEAGAMRTIRFSARFLF